MNKVIIYRLDNGVVAIVRPTQQALSQYSIEAIARKDVPSGKPFAIVDASNIPADRSNRDAWTVDDADLTDGIGADSDTFDEEDLL